MNNEGGVGPGNLKGPQPLQRKVRIAPAQDFQLALKSRRNHRQIGFVLKQGQQAQVRSVGNDLEVMSGLSFHRARKGLSDTGRKGARSLQNKIVRTGCADAG